MRRIARLRTTKPGTVKWALWAERFKARFDRRAGALELALLLHVRANSVALSIVERWLRPAVNYAPQLYLSIRESQVPQVSRAFARHTNVVNHSHAAMPGSLRPEPMRLRDLIAPPRAETRTTLIPRVNGERQEFASILARRFPARRDSVDTRTLERLLHRSERVERSAMPHQSAMLLRSPAPVFQSAPDATLQPNIRAAEEHRSFPPIAHPSPAAAPPINVEQLADQVIRQIDRRVVARRERMGRI
jgi:hypothetical protein